MEFKVTKGKWKLTDRKRGIEVHIKPSVYKSICSSTGNTKWQYDMLLISKAPEMLEMLKSVLDLQRNNYGNATNTHVELIGQAKEIEQLIKQATEL